MGRSAFGLTIRTEMDLPWPPTPSADGVRPVEVTLVGAEVVAETWSGTAAGPTWDTVFPGRRRVTVERGAAGDQLIRYAERDYFLLSADADTVHCAPEDPEDPSWQRFLLDTVLWWTALANGLHVLHAGAVEVDGEVIGILSASGGGKSTLTGELLLRGATLFSDDVLALGPAPDLIAHPGPPLMNLAAGRRDLLPLGRPLARLAEGDDEVWVAVSRAAEGPRPLRALFLYQRDPALELAVAAARPTVLDLTPHAWGIPDDQGAAARRFTLLADLAETIPMYTLTAGAADAPSAIADALTGALV